MYKSPIEVFGGEMETKMEGDIFKVVQNYGINANKEELLNALQYDRNQYHNGYADGYADGFDESNSIVRCRVCKHWWKEQALCVHDKCCHGNVAVVDAPPNHFCGYGERKEK